MLYLIVGDDDHGAATTSEAVYRTILLRPLMVFQVVPSRGDISHKRQSTSDDNKRLTSSRECRCPITNDQADQAAEAVWLLRVSTKARKQQIQI